MSSKVTNCKSCSDPIRGADECRICQLHRERQERIVHNAGWEFHPLILEPLDVHGFGDDAPDCVRQCSCCNQLMIAVSGGKWLPYLCQMCDTSEYNLYSEKLHTMKLGECNE